MSKFKNFDDYRKCVDSLKNRKSSNKTVIAFCSSSGCVANKSAEIMAKFENLIEEHNLKDEVETKCVGCFGFCSQGPFVGFILIMLLIA